MAVPEGRIFLINSMGELHNINHTYRQTYLSLSRQVDLTFPPLPHDGADDAFDGHDPDAEDDDDHDAHETGDAAFDHGSRGLVEASNSDIGGGSASGSFSGLPESKSSSSSFAAAAGGGGGGGGGAPADGSGQDTSGSKVLALADEGGGGDGGAGAGGDGSTARPIIAKASSVVVGGGPAASKAKATVPIPRRWEEVAPRREKSFYPNRAAVEDRFTDLNFWRDPPPLIGDDDDDEDDDEDGDGDGDYGRSQGEDEDEDAGEARAAAAAAAVATKRVLAGSGALEVGAGKIDR